MWSMAAILERSRNSDGWEVKEGEMVEVSLVPEPAVGNLEAGTASAGGGGGAGMNG